jgi:hypothetical protein
MCCYDRFPIHIGHEVLSVTAFGTTKAVNIAEIILLPSIHAHKLAQEQREPERLFGGVDNGIDSHGFSLLCWLAGKRMLSDSAQLALYAGSKQARTG